MSRQFRARAFVGLLVLWPIAVTLGQRWFPSYSGLNIPFAAASLIFYALCAIALRSRAIAGTLLGLSLWPFTSPAVIEQHGEWKIRLLGCALLGIVWGAGWEAIHALKPPKSSSPTG